MTISIGDALNWILSKPHAPVILVDTCNFLDLFRSDVGEAKDALNRKSGWRRIFWIC